MIFFTRSLSKLADLPSAATRRMALALVSMVTVSLTVLVTAAPAVAVVTTVGVQKYGVEPQSEAPASVPTTPLSYEGGPVVHSNAPYALYWDPGDRYAAWEGFTADFLENVNKESGTINNVYAVATQYRDASGNANSSSIFRGAYTDVDHYPSTENCVETGTPCLTDAQIRTELTKYISANDLPTGLNTSTGGTPNPTPIYFVFTPPNVTVCLDTTIGHCSTPTSTEPLCSYHSYTTVNGATVLYAVLPWTSVTACQDGSGLLEEPNKTVADVVVNEIADEQIATITDPLFTAWHDTEAEAHNTDEIPDKCRNDFLPLTGKPPAGEYFNQEIGGIKYYLNDEFDQAALYAPYPGEPCINKVTLEPQFTAQSPVRTGDPVTFNTTESVVSLGIAKYNWNFGDGTTVEVNCGARTPTYHYAPAECNTNSGTGNPNSVASVVHSYTYGGTYEVTLTVTDTGGNVASVTEPITVDGPANPEEKGSGGSGSEGGSGGTSDTTTPATSTTGSTNTPGTTTSSAGSSPAKPIPGPVASTAVVSHSLLKTLKSGLVVNYSVNEQVAGQFQVLLADSVARRIGLHGAPAVGMPPGSTPSIVIAKAILITTKGGRDTVKILLGKQTAAKLRKLRSVSLTVRLVVRNASSHSPLTTTVISTVNLFR